METTEGRKTAGALFLFHIETATSRIGFVPPFGRCSAALQGGTSASIDTVAMQPNNAAMAHREVVRRIKSYSAATGYVYQYQFYDVHPSHRGLAAGREYVYKVSSDRKTMFPLKIFISRDAVDRWAKKTGRPLTGTEEYAAAKMRLFRAFDEIEDLADSRPDLAVDDSNLQALLAQLDL